MKVFCYIRVSSRKQTKGDGPERQEAAIAAFCTAHGLTRCGNFSDAHTGTADAMDRPGFAELMTYVDCRHGSVDQIDAIVVEGMDRLARDLMVSELLLAECRKRGLKVFSADQGSLIDMASDSGDPTRVLIRQLMGALAQWQKSQIVNKLRAARERIRKTAGFCEGAKPFGMNGAEKRVLEMVREMRPEKSYRDIAAFLNASGFFNSAGKPWQAMSIHNLVNRQHKVTS